MTGCRRFALGLLLLCLGRVDALAADGFEDYRWGGADFVFCFVTDDGTRCNLGWAETALDRDFRFTIAINSGTGAAHRLDRDDVVRLAKFGFEIANHGYSHGTAGLPAWCARPPVGSLLGYFQCADPGDGLLMAHFAREIDRRVLARHAGCRTEAVRTFAYPRHLHSRAVVDSLMARGYLGARSGDAGSYHIFGNGDFRRPPRNAWDDGISLFRVPVVHYAPVFFGDHSAVPPVHHTYEEFLAAAEPYIEQAKRDGGLFVLYAHHFGDDCDDAGDVNYGSSGMTPRDLGWIVDLVRERGGKVMPFGEAVAYFRSRSRMVKLDGDYVWVPKPLPEPDPAPAAPVSVRAGPNPFNPATVVEYSLDRDARVLLTVHDVAGRRVRTLIDAPAVAGRHTVGWDGRDASGAGLASGVYFLRIEAGGDVALSRATLLK